ncbi:MAG TPA: hypothetical protein VI011_01075 [Asanoa sp.]
MPGKVVVSLTTGLEDTERVTVAFLVAVGAAEAGRPTLMFLTKEAARLAIDGGRLRGLPAAGRPGRALRRRRRSLSGLPDLFRRSQARQGKLVGHADLGGTVPMWEWIGDAGATTFSY